ncbi:hypothetical protein 13AC503A_gene0028 [Aeromonas phage 13AC503A]|nr:hypothetical protein 13AC503A_gene0028 [Aeromonas phage 13AC503A]
MSQNEIRLRRQRITAPRTVDEAHLIIARIKATFGIEDQEEELMRLLEAQEAKYGETLYEYTMVSTAAAMKAAGITELTMANDALDGIKPDEVMVTFDQETKVTTFRLRTAEELAEWRARPPTERVEIQDDQAGDDNYALPA